MQALVLGAVFAAVSARSVSLSPKLDVVSKAKESLKLGTVTTCSTASSLGKNFVPSSNSTNPAVGDFLGLTFDFDLEQVVTGGQVYYNCTVNGFLPYNTVDDLCADQEDGPDPCPLGVGHHTDTGVIEAASGITKLKCTIQWVTEDWQEILCAIAQWTVSAATTA